MGAHILTVCPKCQKKIPIYHLGQNCPHCGINLRFYNFESDFYRDAKRAELSLAKANIFIAHLKAALIGSKLAIVRLCVMLLPIASLLAPFATAYVKQPFVDESVTVSGLGIYFAYSDGYLDYILAMIKGGADAAAFKALAFAVVGIAVTALIALTIFVLSVISFTSLEKMPKAICALCAIGAALIAASTVLCFRFISVAGSSAGMILSGKMSFGYIVAVAAFAVNFVVNFLIIKKGYNIEYKEGDLERAEIAKKVKAGEVKIDDLPQPIVETEETRKIQLEIEKQQAVYRNLEGGGDSEEV